jgi:hypothetical protein
VGWKKRGNGLGFGFLFFKTSFSFKTLSKLKFFWNFKHYKPFQNFQIILKTFKT